MSGIGCFFCVLGFVNFDGFYMIYGRVLVFVMGIKLINLDFKIIVFMGDGDVVVIGGNYFIYVIRRNFDVIVIFINNFIYGMIGG